MSKSTKQKLCEAAIDLFSKEGYESVTTKKIAEQAGVSEMTLFRHFGTKLNLFQEAYDTYLYQPNFESLFNNGLKGELEKDLLRIGHVYLDVFNMNKSIILMELKSSGLDESVRTTLTKGPKLFKNRMITYLDKLKSEGMILDQDTEMIAVAFVSNIMGHFFREAISKDGITDITAIDSVDFSIRLFAKSIAKTP